MVGRDYILTLSKLFLTLSGGRGLEGDATIKFFLILSSLAENHNNFSREKLSWNTNFINRLVNGWEGWLLNYMLWCWYGNVINLGYSGWSSYRRSLLLLKVLWSWNKFALRSDYSTLKALCISRCMVHFGRFIKSCECNCDHILSVLITASGL